MKGFEKRRLEREALKAREAEEWQADLVRFRSGLEAAGVTLRSLVVEVYAESPSASAELLTWWRRDEMAANIAKVQAAVAADFITHVTLHSGRMAPPGESDTAQMWIDAQEAGDQVLDAALLLTAMRATERRHDIAREPLVEEYRSKLYNWAWDALKAASVNPYTLSSVWFLPSLLSTDRNAKNKNDLVDVIAGNLAAFLHEWTPVRVLVDCPTRSAGVMVVA